MAIDLEIQKLIEKNVIELSRFEKTQYVSPIFIRPKKDGGSRMILDLSELNKNVEYHKFKMDTFQNSTRLVTKDCFMASIDLRDAYYTVPIAPEHRKFLKFSWKGNLWQYKSLPNGLSSGPRIFTKILKPPFAHLRTQGHTVLGYLDDTLVIEKSKLETYNSVSTLR